MIKIQLFGLEWALSDITHARNMVHATLWINTHEKRHGTIVWVTPLGLSTFTALSDEDTELLVKTVKDIETAGELLSCLLWLNNIEGYTPRIRRGL